MDISESPDPQQSQNPQQPQVPPTPSMQMQSENLNDSMMIAAPMVSSNRPNEQLDIDSTLLQQFSCLGTTDHEDLINDLLRLLSNQLNRDTARFFLEMSNWNLQTAICCYLDFCNFQSLPQMKIVEIGRKSEDSQVWKLQNNGEEEWPTGCYLMSPSQTKRLDVPSIRSGDSFEIVADIPRSSPPIMWRLCTPNGWYFGDTIWMIPSDSDDTTVDLAQRMSQLRTTTPMSVDNPPQVNVVILFNMD